MTQNLSIMIAQLEFKVGDISHNSNKILHHYQLASDVDLIIFPELALTGYNIKDMAELKIFQENSQTAMIMLAQATKNNKCTMLVGSIYKQGNDLYNAAFHLAQGEIVQIITKRHLPNNAVFDESRIFSPGTQAKHITIGDTKIGVAICEDVWHDDVTDDLIENGAEIIIAINASPFEIDKLTLRADIIKQQVRKHHIPFVYVNSIGGQDELVFDGGSFVIEANGEKTFALACFQEQSQLLSLRKTDSNWHSNALNQLKFPSRNEQMYQAAVLALKSYVQNNNFSGVILGLSGGIDSSLTAAIAVDALGSHSVRGVLMPSPYTTTTSIDDALTLAATLAIQTETISIDELMLATKNSLAQSFAGYEDDITEENIQARLRGLLLMALSNKFNLLVLATGNKSENAVGYSTIYGDMVGGFNPIKDIYKTDVYKLCHWRNIGYFPYFYGLKGKIFSNSVLNKAPTAELKPNQTDQDSLPPYAVLDAILFELIENHSDSATLLQQGFDKITVEKVTQLLYRAEYKRRQSAPGPKISSRHLGLEWRYSINNSFVS